jgi:hypothetical protein
MVRESWMKKREAATRTQGAPNGLRVRVRARVENGRRANKLQLHVHGLLERWRGEAEASNAVVQEEAMTG